MFKDLQSFPLGGQTEQCGLGAGGSQAVPGGTKMTPRGLELQAAANNWGSPWEARELHDAAGRLLSSHATILIGVPYDAGFGTMAEVPMMILF